MRQIPDVFCTTPIVYAVGQEYQILVPVSSETIMWVQVGEERYCDDSNGVFRSNTTTHKMTVPMDVLDRAGGYTVCFRRVIERKPYFSKTGEIEQYTSVFRPIPRDGQINIYHIADAHNVVEAPVAAARCFGKPDLLILNGDIPNHSGKLSYLTTIHQLASEITDGEAPVIFSRGNHDTRGIFAENIADHTPTRGGYSYFSFRLGKIWGLVLDCGEDKADDHPEYGNTICCSDFRRRETEYLKNVVKHSVEEYDAEGVKNRLVIVHSPFTQSFEAPFDIEDEVYSEWTELLRAHVKPQLMLCGHVHDCRISHVGSKYDNKGQFCPVICGSRPENERFIATSLTLDADGCRVIFNDSLKNILHDEYIKF